MTNIINKILVLIFIIPSIIVGSIVPYQCKTYQCFIDFEKKYGITDYDAKIDKNGVYTFKYDTDDINKTKKINKIKTKNKKKQKNNFKNKKILSKYEQALKEYKKHNFKKSYELLDELFHQNLNNVNINYYLGRSAYKLEKYDEAILAYDRVLFEQANSSKVKLELAKSYLKLKDYKQSKKYLLEIKSSKKTNENVRKKIDVLLSIIDNKIKKNFLNGVVLVGLNYDSNINSDPKNYILNGISSKEIAAWAHQEVFLLNHKYILDETQLIKNDFMFFNKSMIDTTYKDKNIQMFSYTPTYNVAYENGYNVDYSLFADALKIDGKYNMQSYGINPKLNYMYNKDTNMIFGLKYQDKNYQQKIDKNRNSKFMELSGSSKYILNDSKSFGVSLSYARERKDAIGRIDIDKNQIMIKLDGTYYVNTRLNFTPSFTYKNIKYKDQDPFKTAKRKDNVYRLALASTYAYKANWLIQGLIDTLKNNSNFDENTYNKNTFTVNVVRPF